MKFNVKQLEQLIAERVDEIIEGLGIVPPPMPECDLDQTDTDCIIADDEIDPV